jgi:hypothetical protein
MGDLFMKRNAGPGHRVWTFAEADYRSGVGPLHMTVEQVDWARPQRREDDVWYEVRGMEFSADGRTAGPRQVLIRGERLSRIPRNTRP